MKHRILSLLLAGSLLFGLVGCGRKPAMENETDWGQYVTLGTYKGVEVTGPNMKVSDEEVEESIQSVLEGFTALNQVDRAATATDTVHVDYTGKLNGKEFDGGSVTGEDFDISTSDFIPGLAEAMIGKKAGDTFSVDITMPTDYWVSEVAGQKVTYDITVYDVYEREVPELTDDLIQQVSDKSQTVAEYRKELRAEMEETLKNEGADTLAQSVWAKVVESCTVNDYPEEELSAYKEQIISYYQDEADANQAELDAYLKDEYSTTKEEVLAEADQYAKSEVGERMIALAIAQKEKIFLTEEEYQEKAQGYAEDWNLTSVEELEQQEGKEAVYRTMVWDLVLDWLTENAKVTEGESTSLTEEDWLATGDSASEVTVASEEEGTPETEPEAVG